ETIIGKAMAKNPDERYGTAQELADDLCRFLEDKPIRAKRPTLRQRAAKWARRHQGVVATAIAGLTVAVGILPISTLIMLAAYQGAKDEANRAGAAEQEMRRQWYAASISAMQQAWDTGQVSRLRALLAETQTYPDRGFEWYYCQRLCHLELHTF